MEKKKENIDIQSGDNYIIYRRQPLDDTFTLIPYIIKILVLHNNDEEAWCESYNTHTGAINEFDNVWIETIKKGKKLAPNVYDTISEKKAAFLTAASTLVSSAQKESIDSIIEIAEETNAGSTSLTFITDKGWRVSIKVEAPGKFTDDTDGCNMGKNVIL